MGWLFGWGAVVINIIAIPWDIIYMLKPIRNDRRLFGDNFKAIFLKENVCILIQISSTFVPMGWIKNNSALFQEMV